MISCDFNISFHLQMSIIIWAKHCFSLPFSTIDLTTASEVNVAATNIHCKKFRPIFAEQLKKDFFQGCVAF